jgi:putative endonuclease
MTNKNNRVLYTGITNNLERRIYEHKNKIHKHSFASKYNCNKLVFYEKYSHIQQALLREKQIKAGNRQRKLNLIYDMNPNWVNLSIDW